MTNVHKFPVLDFDRPGTEDERIVQSDEMVTFRVDETDEWVNMPVRVLYVDDGISGFVFEVGPYSVDGADALTLANALIRYGRQSGQFRPTSGAS